MGRTISDGVLTSGSPSVSSATACFTDGDVGKTLVGSGIPDNTTIVTVISTSAAVMSANATSSEVNVTITFSVTVTTDDLDSLLDLGGTIDLVRGQLLLDLAIEQCETIASPCPQTARLIIYNVAARAYLNPTGVTSETIGPATVNFGSTGIGIYLRPAEVTTLRRLAGMGGAFTVDPTPANAGRELYPWDLNLWDLGGDPLEAGTLDDGPAWI